MSLVSMPSQSKKTSCKRSSVCGLSLSAVAMGSAVSSAHCNGLCHNTASRSATQAGIAAVKAAACSRPSLPSGPKPGLVRPRRFRAAISLRMAHEQGIKHGSTVPISPPDSSKIQAYRPLGASLGTARQEQG